jgi:glycosyltransferase involved in cell wall biosynthesis
MRISIIHPSRQRPELSLKTIYKWISWAITGPEVIISIDEDDPFKMAYIEYAGKLDVKIIANKNRSAIDAINRGAEAATGDIFIVVSDDTDCFERWDEAILKEVGDRTDWIMKTQDGIQSWLITMTLMDRTYYNRFGYIYQPDYKHLWADTELTAVADLTGRLIKSDLLFRHIHPCVKLAEEDDLYRRNNGTWVQGETLFKSRLKKKFGLKETPGKIQIPQYAKAIQ